MSSVYQLATSSVRSSELVATSALTAALEARVQVTRWLGPLRDVGPFRRVNSRTRHLSRVMFRNEGYALSVRRTETNVTPNPIGSATRVPNQSRLCLGGGAQMGRAAC